MTRYGVDYESDYFEWLFNLMCGQRFSKRVSYRRLLRYLHSAVFEYTLPMDEDRAKDGIYLRWRYTCDVGLKEYEDIVLDRLDGPCSVLEMIAALAIRCEETIMDDPTLGDRTGQWFWNMITNLGLGSMTDDNFDIDYVEDTVYRFLDRQYEPDGRGGLFTVRHCDLDMRHVEIWRQFTYYLNTII